MERNLRTFGLRQLSAAAFALTAGIAVTSPARAATESAPAADAGFSFVVSGDSRNCGNIVMPEIAQIARAAKASFYWHLGDFRWIYDIDEDLAADSTRTGPPLDKETYKKIAWKDFEDNQLKVFSPTKVYLAIGNHELGDVSREEYINAFRSYLDRPEFFEASPGKQPPAHKVEAYFHWRIQNVEFISLDNASSEQFDKQQMGWFADVLAKAVADRKIKTIVVGMHSTLPDSISYGHSMSESNNPNAVESGRKVYAMLLHARDKAHKHVYALSSHSHFLMEGAFNTQYWKEHGGVLDAWVVGTAGARRHPLPPAAKDAKFAKDKIYGGLVAHVNPSGVIDFKFSPLEKIDVLPEVAQKYGKKTVDFCFEQNVSDHAPGPARDRVAEPEKK